MLCTSQQIQNRRAACNLFVDNQMKNVDEMKERDWKRKKEATWWEQTEGKNLSRVASKKNERGCFIFYFF